MALALKIGTLRITNFQTACLLRRWLVSYKATEDERLLDFLSTCEFHVQLVLVFGTGPVGTNASVPGLFC
jgi:hypothetical protein